jgi:hypothetical protein
VIVCTRGSGGSYGADLVEGGPDELRRARVDLAAMDRLGGPWMGSTGLSKFFCFFIDLPRWAL